MNKGGFDPFTFNITPYLVSGIKQEIKVSLWDPTDEGPQPCGKQVKKPEGIWYTPVTGIWQTVWLEGVSKTYIEATKQTPDIDNHTLAVSVDVKNSQPGDQVKITALDGKTAPAWLTGLPIKRARRNLKVITARNGMRSSIPFTTIRTLWHGHHLTKPGDNLKR